MIVKKIILIVSLSLICISALSAGDTASFVDLGFSQDGRTYMFGQFGVQEGTLKPWAELYIVDVGRNNFVPNGRISRTHNTPITAGQDGSGILYQLMTENSSFASRHGVNYQNQGLPLYISRDEAPPPHGEIIDFRDFVSGNTYKARLVSNVEGVAANTRSSFYINLECRTKDGQLKNYTVGTPQLRRPGITTYNIKRVLINTGGNSLIFVIEMKRIAQNGFDIRYMVEAVRL